MPVEPLKTLWRESSPLRRGLLVGVPVAVIALAGVVVGLAFSVGGSSSGQAQEVVATATPEGTPVPPTPSVEQVLRYLAALMPTATPEPPVSAGLQATDGGGGSYTAPSGGDDGGGGGGGGAVLSGGGGTGPGPVLGTDMSLSIPAIGVNATVYSRTVGTNGQMGNPSGPWDVIWYDFSEAWVGLGGRPGEPGANAVFAGHVDYIRVGPAVFWSIRDLQPGDTVTVYTGNGPITYQIQWSQWADPGADFSQFVSRTGQDSITLVTCIGGFSAGHYSNRLIVRGVRV